MFSAVNGRNLLMGLIALALLGASSFAYADWGVGINIGDGGYHHDDHHFYRYHEHPHYGYRMHFLPDGYFTVWVGGERYFYYDGLYYARVEGGYALVEPPFGATVDVIPPDFHPVFINGVTYYTDNGTYYILTRHHGYKVVAPPVVYAQPATVVVAQPEAPVVVMQPAPVAHQDTFTVNVPNDRGGYMPVVIVKSGNGFKGPQGEFYSEFPKVSQLKAMYGK